MKTSPSRRPHPAPFPDRINNRLLLALPREKLDRLRPNLELVDLPRGQILFRPNELIDYVYFPEEGMVSRLLECNWPPDQACGYPVPSQSGRWG
jgi:hypothetical protein